MTELVKTTNQDVDAIDKDRVRRLVRKGTVSHLSPERETAPFLLYLNGESIASISQKQAIPRDIIEATAVHYDWEAKRASFTSSGLSLPAELQKRITNTLLITTLTAIDKELAEVASGVKDAKDCLLIPKNIRSLRELIDLVNIANGLVDKGEAQAPQVAVQIVNTPGQDPEIKSLEDKRAEADERARILREMAIKK